MAAEWLGRLVDGVNLTEREKPTTRCRRCFIVRYEETIVRIRLSGQRMEEDSSIRSPRFGDEEVLLRTPHQRWSHGAEKSDAQDAFNVSR